MMYDPDYKVEKGKKRCFLCWQDKGIDNMVYKKIGWPVELIEGQLEEIPVWLCKQCELVLNN